MRFFGQRHDPIAAALNSAWRNVNTLRDRANKETARDGCPSTETDAALVKAEAAHKIARKNYDEREVQKKITREANKALRAQGIDPTKKPASMTPEQFEASRVTLRAAIQPQFPAYKAALFRYLRQNVDVILDRLADANGDAIAAAYAPTTAKALREELRTKSRDWEHRFERATIEAKLDAGRAFLSELYKWTKEGEEVPYAEREDRHMRIPLSDGNIDAVLDAEAHAMTERDFDSYTQKLAGKIGLVIERAHVIGNLWQASVLVAHIEAGFWNESNRQPVQRWSTKMILNRSVLNKLFNQWPTRRIDLNSPEKS